MTDPFLRTTPTWSSDTRIPGNEEVHPLETGESEDSPIRSEIRFTPSRKVSPLRKSVMPSGSC